MNTYYKHIASKIKGPIPIDDAVQLYLWMFCYLSILPYPLKDNPPTKEELILVFTTLAKEGLIKAGDNQVSDLQQDEWWRRLIRDLLLKNINLDESFPQRSSAYL